MITCVTDLAYGDTGKGKIIDSFSSVYDYIVRFNGGPNAGHTVMVEGQKHVLHHLPSGLFSDRSDQTIVLSGGMVINPVTLAKEINLFKSQLSTKKLLLSNRIHCIMPWHINEDIVMSKKSLGTTCTGIGPCYADKMYRTRAIRLENLSSYLSTNNDFIKEMIIRHRSGSIIDGQIQVNYEKMYESYEEHVAASKFLEEFIHNESSVLRQAVENSKNILFESAHGINLDIDHGGYPFVSSSGCGPAFIPQSCGLPNLHIDKIVGITKSYITRVGEGKLDTELDDAMSNSIRNIGNEYGATTGRPRRIGFLDLDILKEGIAKTGTTEIAITHMDTLMLACKENGRKTFNYKLNSEIHEFNIWESISDYRMHDFVDMVYKALQRPVSYLGTGRDRKELIVL